MQSFAVGKYEKSQLNMITRMSFTIIFPAMLFGQLMIADGYTPYSLLSPWSSHSNLWKQKHFASCIKKSRLNYADTADIIADKNSTHVAATVLIEKESSKRNMLTFAIPALGIYLANPLLSNIDNAFVGRTVGTAGLAALSPATICTDQMLYMFAFLGRATTGMVSRAYASTEASDDYLDQKKATGNKKAAREVASART
jgi:hypothetical protein